MSNMVGLDRLLRNLNSKVAKIENLSIAGLWEAGLKIQAASQARTPVDTGTLKASAYTRKVGDKLIEIGHSAAYAVFVHENLESHHPVGEAKFLEHAFSENEPQILAIIAHHAARAI